MHVVQAIKSSTDDTSRNVASWARVTKQAPWSPRAGGSLLWYRGTLTLVGVGIYDQDEKAVTGQSINQSTSSEHSYCQYV
jgi:hypothetical protein